MKAYCLFREEKDSPILSGVYDFNSGLINGISEKKFKVYIKRVLRPNGVYRGNVGVNNSLENKRLYQKLFNNYNVVFGTNLQNIGVIGVTSDGINVSLLHKESNPIFYPLNFVESVNIFSYDKKLIGVYKTIIRTIYEPTFRPYIYVDKNNKFLLEEGEFEYPFKKVPSKVSKNSLDAGAKLIRGNVDLVLIDYSNKLRKYKVRDKKLIEV